MAMSPLLLEIVAMRLSESSCATLKPSNPALMVTSTCLVTRSKTRSLDSGKDVQTASRPSDSTCRLCTWLLNLLITGPSHSEKPQSHGTSSCLRARPVSLCHSLTSPPAPALAIAFRAGSGTICQALLACARNERVR